MALAPGRWRAVLAGLVVGLADAAAAGAGSVTLEIGLDCAADPAPACFVAVTNMGPEAARDVRVDLMVRDARQQAEVAALLDPGDTVTRAFPLPIEPGATGSRAVTVTVAYADVNGYPLSAVAAAILPLTAEGPAQLTAALADLQLADRGALELTLRSAAPEPFALTVRWVLPRELTLQEGTREVRLVPARLRRERFRVVNRGALEGSSYPVYAVLEWQGREGPGAALVPGRIVVTPTDSPNWRRVMVGVLALLLAAWLGAQWRGRMRR